MITIDFAKKHHFARYLDNKILTPLASISCFHLKKYVHIMEKIDIYKLKAIY